MFSGFASDSFYCYCSSKERIFDVKKAGIIFLYIWGGFRLIIQTNIEGFKCLDAGI